MTYGGIFVIFEMFTYQFGFGDSYRTQNIILTVVNFTQGSIWEHLPYCWGGARIYVITSIRVPIT